VSIKPGSFILGAIAGAAAEYFLDPQGGNRRRSVATDKAGKYAREGAQEVARKADYAAGQAKGAAAETAKTVKSATVGGNGKTEELNDPALARKVESEIFRDANAPKGKVDVNVENGVVYLRGKVDQETAEKLVSEAQQVEGVERVESLLETAK
jgi:osmotically-inducible protein OsmY